MIFSSNLHMGELEFVWRQVDASFGQISDAGNRNDECRVIFKELILS